MTFAQTHDTLWYSPKFRKLTFSARGLWVTCQSWCAGQLTDGLIPESAVKDVGGTDPQIRALVKSGLWEETETKDGELAYQFHDWLDHNESAVKVSTRKRKEKERAAARREAKNIPESGESSTRSRTESNGSSTRTEAEIGESSIRNAPEMAGILADGTQPDLRKPENDRAIREKKGTKTNPKSRHLSVCPPARPTGEAHTLESETEAKEEAEEEPKKTPILSHPRFSPSRLAERQSSPQGKEPVVDTSDSEDRDSALGLLQDGYNYAPYTNPSGGAGNTSARPPGGQGDSSWDNRERQIGKPLEQMTPNDLLLYIVSSQEELNGITPSDPGSKGVAAMKGFQNRYGADRAAAIMRHLFVKERGKREVGKNGVEHITYSHFTEPLSWFTDKVDVETQAKSNSERYVASEFVFATEL